MWRCAYLTACADCFIRGEWPAGLMCPPTCQPACRLSRHAGMAGMHRIAPSEVSGRRLPHLPAFIIRGEGQEAPAPASLHHQR